MSSLIHGPNHADPVTEKKNSGGLIICSLRYHVAGAAPPVRRSSDASVGVSVRIHLRAICLFKMKWASWRLHVSDVTDCVAQECVCVFQRARTAGIAKRGKRDDKDNIQTGDLSVFSKQQELMPPNQVQALSTSAWLWWPRSGLFPLTHASRAPLFFESQFCS